jgi:hypothetical protein
VNKEILLSFIAKTDNKINDKNILKQDYYNVTNLTQGILTENGHKNKSIKRSSSFFFLFFFLLSVYNYN